MTTVRWQGGAEHDDELVVRVGGLYLLDDTICFLDAGRHVAFVASKTLAGAGAVLLGIPAVIEGYAQMWLGGRRGGAPFLAEVIAGTGAIVCLVLAAITYRQARRDHEAMLATVGEPVGDLDAGVLVSMCEASPSSLVVPLADLVSIQPVDAEFVELRTRLDDVLRLRVLPDRDGFVALVNSARGA